MATNAFLSWSLGPQYNFTLLGLTEMPKPGTPPELAGLAIVAMHAFALSLLRIAKA